MHSIVVNALITVWLQVRVLPGPPIFSMAYVLRASMTIEGHNLRRYDAESARLAGILGEHVRHQFAARLRSAIGSALRLCKTAARRGGGGALGLVSATA